MTCSASITCEQYGRVLVRQSHDIDLLWVSRFSPEQNEWSMPKVVVSCLLFDTGTDQ